jgi:hypothetical protein
MPFTGWERDNAKFEAQLKRLVKALHAVLEGMSAVNHKSSCNLLQDNATLQK